MDAELESLFSSLRSRLADAVGTESADVYANLPQEEKTALASELVRCGRDVSELSILKDNGQFVYFLRPQGIVAVFRYDPKLFFDGKVWNITYADISKIDAVGAERIQAQIKNELGSLLEIASVYAGKGAGNPKEADDWRGPPAGSFSQSSVLSNSHVHHSRNHQSMWVAGVRAHDLASDDSQRIQGS